MTNPTNNLLTTAKARTNYLRPGEKRGASPINPPPKTLAELQRRKSIITCIYFGWISGLVTGLFVGLII